MNYNPDNETAYEGECRALELDDRAEGDDSCHACDNPYCRGDVCSLDNLARNLRDAAMLGWSYRLGDKRGMQATWDGINGRREDPHVMWRPGCGRAAKGGE
jgi:hypothetical protein